ncbi:hypothetical protein KCU78_g4820, partial [Aureobasidium melanogenum]
LRAPGCAHLNRKLRKASTPTDFRSTTCACRGKSDAREVESKTKRTAAGIPTWSPTVVLICRSTAYVWQSGRDAQFSADCGLRPPGSPEPEDWITARAKSAILKDNEKERVKTLIKA